MVHGLPGVLINFEGVEGCGKSTQAELLVRWLVGLGLDFVITREPGGTKIGEKVRDILLDAMNQEMDDLTEGYLYSASRRQHVIEKLFPRCLQGKGTVTDRYLDSSLAYQSGGRKLGVRRILELNREAIMVEHHGRVIPLLPDLTVILDSPVEKGLGRAKSRGELDRLEMQRLEFHKRVEEGYIKLAKGVYSNDFLAVFGVNYPYALIQTMDGPRERTRNELEKEVRAVVVPILRAKKYNI